MNIFRSNLLIIFIVFSGITFTGGSSSNPQADTAELLDHQFITFKALIEGNDVLSIGFTGIRYVHLGSQLPGLFNGENVSTSLNGSEWYPIWSNINSTNIQTSSFTNQIQIFPLLDRSMNVSYEIEDLTITNYSDEGGERPSSNVEILTLPNPYNYTPLSIVIRDKQSGAAWYEFSIHYYRDYKMNVDPITETTVLISTTGPNSTLESSASFNDLVETIDGSESQFSPALSNFLIFLLIASVLVIIVRIVKRRQKPTSLEPIVHQSASPELQNLIARIEMNKLSKDQVKPKSTPIRYCLACNEDLQSIAVFCANCGAKT